MLKLYKRVGQNLHYWEAWDADDSVTVHSGIVGTRGESRDVPLKAGESAKRVIEREARSPVGQGYRPWDEEKLDTMVVQYAIDGHGTDEDLSNRHAIENYLNEEIGWIGAGHLDGGDIGSGTMNIFLMVVDAEVCGSPIIESLRRQDLLEGATVAYQRAGEDKYTVLWPHDYVGEFSAI